MIIANVKEFNIGAYDVGELIFKDVYIPEKPDPDMIYIFEKRKGRGKEIIKYSKTLDQLTWDEKKLIALYRDGYICRVCYREAIEDEKGHHLSFHLGHLIDRCVGGSDDLDNLVIMCTYCNLNKEFTETIEEYIEWAKYGGPSISNKFDCMKEACNKFNKNILEFLNEHVDNSFFNNDVQASFFYKYIKSIYGDLYNPKYLT